MMSPHQAHQPSPRTPDIVAVIVDGRIESISTSVTAILGWPVAELVGTSASSLVHPDDLADVMLVHAQNRTRTPRSVRFRLRTRDGGWRWVDDVSRLVPADTAHGTSRRTVSALVDVQSDIDELEAQQRLERARRLEDLGLLAGGIAHDFNNILHAIQASAELAVRCLDDPAEAAVLLDDVIAGTRRAAALTGKLLDYAGRRPMEPGLVPLREVVEDSLRAIGPCWPSTVAVDIDIDRQLQVLGDRTQLQQIVTNLIHNAAQACSASSGRVCVRGSRPVRGDDSAAVVVLSVIDDGAGIGADVIGRIFEPFFTTKPAGCGLGLSVVHGLVGAMGGEIDVASEVGRGTTFVLRLPLGSR
jgi:PAS domain S-box-containing protein